VSVVVLAHTRSQFLRRAVTSAAVQRPDELLVVKFGRDPELDEELTQQGVRVHVTQEPYQGGKVADGIDLARGDVVVFLDDDDVLLPGKVDRVRNVFRDPGAVFHANRFVAFTDTPPPSGSMGPVELFEPGSGNLYRAGLRPVITSCMSVRKGALAPWLDDLRKLTIADHSVFIMAVTARKRMAMDQSVLTGYHLNVADRAYRSSSSIWASPGVSPNRDIRWMLDVLDREAGGVHETLNPVVADAIIHLVFLSRETHFHEYRRTMRAILRGVGVRRPLTVPTLLMFGYPLAPRVAVVLGRTWWSLVGPRRDLS